MKYLSFPGHISWWLLNNIPHITHIVMSHKYSRWNLFTRSYIFLMKGVYSAINSIQAKLPQKMQQGIKSFIPKTAINSHLLHDIVWSKLPVIKLIWLVQCFKHQVYLSYSTWVYFSIFDDQFHLYIYNFIFTESCFSQLESNGYSSTFISIPCFM